MYHAAYSLKFRGFAGRGGHVRQMRDHLSLMSKSDLSCRGSPEEITSWPLFARIGCELGFRFCGVDCQRQTRLHEPAWLTTNCICHFLVTNLPFWSDKHQKVVHE